MGKADTAYLPVINLSEADWSITTRQPMTHAWTCEEANSNVVVSMWARARTHTHACARAPHARTHCWRTPRYASLEGYHFTVIIGHLSYSYLDRLKYPMGRLARWALFLQQFDVKYRKGKLNALADTLSHQDPAERDTTPMSAICTTKDDWHQRLLSRVRGFRGQARAEVLRTVDGFK